ncbi:hypothetical protein [Miltoncostaea oceani]|uniref:hypothetical protein n=1 Tax=Miltoncostaea oceani TaxID=2843216 RepID=UPI001C3CCBB0|nr:hypothetical protein [Miltoncostaea oceani]
MTGVGDPPLPDGALVQSVFTAEGVSSGWRVWDDGRHESMRDGGDWTAAPPLGPEAVAEVRRVLAEAGLASIAGVHDDPEVRGGGGVLRFAAAAPGGPFVVELRDGVSPAPLERLVARLVPILAGRGPGA